MIRLASRGLLVLAFLGAAFAASACSSDEITSPVAPTPTQVTDTFAGTLTVNGATTYQFVSNRGAVTATLTSVAPDSTIAIGFSLGSWNGSTCAAILPNDQAIQGSVIYGTVNTTGTLCLRVYDVGKLVDPLTFEVSVVHF
jgi:hypothetical protein